MLGFDLLLLCSRDVEEVGVVLDEEWWVRATEIVIVVYGHSDQCIEVPGYYGVLAMDLFAVNIMVTGGPKGSRSACSKYCAASALSLGTSLEELLGLRLARMTLVNMAGLVSCMHVSSTLVIDLHKSNPKVQLDHDILADLYHCDLSEIISQASS